MEIGDALTEGWKGTMVAITAATPAADFVRGVDEVTTDLMVVGGGGGGGWCWMGRGRGDVDRRVVGTTAIEVGASAGASSVGGAVVVRSNEAADDDDDGVVREEEETLNSGGRT